MIQQRSAEWFAARLGKVTASRVSDVITRTKSGWSTSRASYLNQLLAERLTGATIPGQVTAAMQWGIDHEFDARLAYQFRCDTEVSEAGFVDHPHIDMSGASPDGYVGADGLVEFKCPTTQVHLGVLLERKIPDRHRLQILWQLACTGRDWCDYVSYDPRLREGARIFVSRVERDAKQLADLEVMVGEFLAEVDALVALLDRQYAAVPIGLDRWHRLNPTALPFGPAI